MAAWSRRLTAVKMYKLLFVLTLKIDAWKNAYRPPPPVRPELWAQFRGELSPGNGTECKKVPTITLWPQRPFRLNNWERWTRWWEFQLETPTTNTWTFIWVSDVRRSALLFRVPLSYKSKKYSGKLTVETLPGKLPFSLKQCQEFPKRPNAQRHGFFKALASESDCCDVNQQNRSGSANWALDHFMMRLSGVGVVWFKLWKHHLALIIRLWNVTFRLWVGGDSQLLPQ